MKRSERDGLQKPQSISTDTRSEALVGAAESDDEGDDEEADAEPPPPPPPDVSGLVLS